MSGDPRQPEADRRSDPAVGLCSICRWSRPVHTRRGSVFWRCGRADEDPAFARYPPLPVRACPGFTGA